ncbi:MAG: hypothetical protein JNL68_08400 [Burkholderiales bacterium]|nr:hypothetical protein [Burkholderiales bacterium]
MKVLDPIENLPAESEDDSSFVSMADFLSLISLSFIYMAIVFGTPMAARDSVEAVQSERVKAGPGIPREASKAYVAFLTNNSGVLLVRVVPPYGAPTQERMVLLLEGDSLSTVEWVANILTTGPAPEEVILFLPADEGRKEVHSLFVEISRRLERTYRVRHIL